MNHLHNQWGFGANFNTYPILFFTTPRKLIDQKNQLKNCLLQLVVVNCVYCISSSKMEVEFEMKRYER